MISNSKKLTLYKIKQEIKEKLPSTITLSNYSFSESGLELSLVSPSGTSADFKFYVEHYYKDLIKKYKLDLVDITLAPFKYNVDIVIMRNFNPVTDKTDTIIKKYESLIKSVRSMSKMENSKVITGMIEDGLIPIERLKNG